VPAPNLFYEKKAYRAGYKFIAGIDEAGRGCLAGPVVAAAVILPKDFKIEGIKDSKALTPPRREFFYQIINKQAIGIGIGIVSNEEIDNINILQATVKAMKLAIKNLPVVPDYLLIDALSLGDVEIPQKSIIKGDNVSLSIASASIIAKVTRDRIMRNFHRILPDYNFASHKGYATKEHIRLIKLHGPSSIHRKSFLRKILQDIK